MRLAETLESTQLFGKQLLKDAQLIGFRCVITHPTYGKATVSSSKGV